MHQALQDSIIELYAACSEFPKPAQLNSCECCHTEDEKQILLSTPLKSLSSEQLNNFTLSAFNTIGCAEDFLYFLPRILELVFTSYQNFDCDVGLLGHKIYQTQFWTRSEKLKESINAALLNHFKYQVLQDTDWNYELSGWVCCIGNATPDLEPFLELLFHSDFFQNFYNNENQYALKGKLSDSFWEQHHGNQNKIIQWLLRPESNERYWTFYPTTTPS